MGLYRILLVDDEEEVRRGIIRKMEWECLGFQVAGDAENGEEALEKVEQLQPDVVITDIRMPYMDGLTLTQQIHCLPQQLVCLNTTQLFKHERILCTLCKLRDNKILPNDPCQIMSLVTRN